MGHPNDLVAALERRLAKLAKERTADPTPGMNTELDRQIEVARARLFRAHEWAKRIGYANKRRAG